MVYLEKKETMRSFASDNNSGVHPDILKSLQDANQDHAIGYGDDPWTQRVEELFKKHFGRQSSVYLTFNGTGSNVIALQAVTQPYHAIYCSQTAHILVDECGAPVKSTGCQLVAIPSPDGKLTPERVQPYIKGVGDPHHSQPRVIYLSQCTELGTVYSIEELKALTDFAHRHQMYVHMDGARLANAAVQLNCSLQAMTADCGIDILSFGGTKNGMMMGEAVVLFRPELADRMRFIRKQSAQLASKMRYLSCQFEAYFSNDLWLKNAQHANRMAEKLAAGLREYKEIHFTQPVQSNALFLQMPDAWIKHLRQRYVFYDWNAAIGEVRLVTSFDTTESDVDDLLAFLRMLQ